MKVISIHALREESDKCTQVILAAKDSKISIHALREESDVCTSRQSIQTYYFNPRSP